MFEPLTQKPGPLCVCFSSTRQGPASQELLQCRSLATACRPCCVKQVVHSQNAHTVLNMLCRL